MKNLLTAAVISALLMPFSATAQAPAQLMRIGAAGAVAGRVQATPAAEGSIGRVISSGQPLYLNDKITTDAQGRLQVLLQDETVFTIGPNSAMVLDEFVYNPSNGAGKVTARILKGIFRFVSGRIASKKPSDMTVKMPVGVIGIRGTLAGGEVNDDGGLVVLFGPKAGNNAGNRKGQLHVTGNDGKGQDILVPGFGSKLDKNGAGKPFKVPQDKLDFLSGLGGGGNGGGQGGKGGDKGGKGGKDSGQDSGKGLDNLNNNKDVNGAFDNTSGTINSIINTFNQGILDGPSTWDQVRTIETGVGTYSGTGVFTQTQCSFTSCNFQGTTSIVMDINFGTRVVGGGSSTLSISQTSGFGPIGTPSYPIQPTSFGSLSGTATFTPAFSTSGSTPVDGTSMTLQNQGGVAAAAVKVNVIYNNTGSGAMGSGTIVAPR